MSFRTHITIADRGWILEKLAREIAVRSNSVSYGTEPDPSADLHYYINYSCRHRRAGPVEIAFFTHSENDPNARKRYFDIAADVEHSVCMSRRYAEELTEAGIKDVTTITPGVDLDAFTPKVRIGVIGRTYHTGRKGEALVADVMEVPGIEWRFTGQGWPGPSTFISDGKMPDFYNDLDYVLVPALYEGGPMCVLEALACGKPVIASNVGWVDEYPHIPFETGNADSLRKVLTGLVDERLKLREAVAHRTWSAWGDAHIDLFNKVARTHGIVSKTGKAPAKAAKTGDAAKASSDKVSALLLTHGGEGKTLGGPSVRVPRTAGELARFGVGASLAKDSPATKSKADVVHVFNCWPLESAFNTLAGARRTGKPTVFSPIFLNLTPRDTYDRSIPALIAHNLKSPGVITSGLNALKEEVIASDSRPPVEPFPGYADKLATCLHEADHLIFLSDYEKRCVEQMVGIPNPSSIVRNPVDSDRFDKADPDLFRTEFGLDKYILCVGRIESRKNQLLLAYAARSLDVPVVFIGHDGNAGYGKLVREVAPDSAIFVPRIEPDDPRLASAFAGASAFCLPSWAEGAPLAALEACAAGAPLVLSDRASEEEYFGDLGRYVNPADLDGLIAALNAAVDEADDEALRERRRQLARTEFTWAKHVKETAEVYGKAIAAHETAAPNVPATTADNGKIYIDLTTSWHHSGHPTGIARVEEKALGALLGVYGARIVPIAWNSKTHNYLKLSIADALASGDTDHLTKLETSGKAVKLDPRTLDPGRILMFGGAWIRNSNFISALRQLKIASGLNLTLLVHDIIQYAARHLYPSDVADVFVQNLADMVDCADSFLAYSDCTIRDLTAYLATQGEHLKPIQKFRLGDIRSDEAELGDDLLERSETCASLLDQDFVIYVSSLDLRKNHILLINVWRRLVQQRGERAPQLLLVGRNMWRGEQIMELVAGEPQLARKVKFLQNVDDEELHWLYSNCKFTLYPSLYEGWGLPVAESLANGKVCLASSSTSTAEIAPDLTELLDPYDFKAWLEKVCHFIDNPAALTAREDEIRNNFSFVDWDESVSQIVSAVDTVALRDQHLPVVWAQSSLCFSEKTDHKRLIDIIRGNNWGRLERSGCWTTGKKAPLEFSTSVRGGEPIFLRIQGFAFTEPDVPVRSIHIRIGDTFFETYMVSTRPGFIGIEIDPASLPQSDPGFGDIRLSIETDQELCPASLTSSSDRRILGFHLMQIAIARSAEALDQLLPGTTGPRWLTEAEQANRAILYPSQKVQTGLSTQQKRSLEEVLAILDTPKTLAPTNPLFKILHALKADVFLLKVYGKMTGRTHDALRRTISTIVNEDQ